MKNIIKKLILIVATGTIFLVASFLAISPSKAKSLLIGNVQTKKECYVSPEQTVEAWSYFYYELCEYAIKGVCLWPIRRKHFTYKVTLQNGDIPQLDHYDRIQAAVNSKGQNWSTFDSEAWNFIEYSPFEITKYPNHRTTAENEIVVSVTTRYKWFNDVEATLGICVQEH